MDAQSLISHVGFLIERSMGIWFPCWALRYRAGWDYKLNGAAKIARWTIVVVGYSVGASLPGPAAVRLVPGFVGVGFLCWPNFAYRLAKLLAKWPVAAGRVVSITKTESGIDVMYEFQGEEGRLGGMASLAASSCGRAVAGQTIAVRYDPLNPGESELIGPRQLTRKCRAASSQLPPDPAPACTPRFDCRPYASPHKQSRRRNFQP